MGGTYSSYCMVITNVYCTLTAFAFFFFLVHFCYKDSWRRSNYHSLFAGKETEVQRRQLKLRPTSPCRIKFEGRGSAVIPWTPVLSVILQFPCAMDLTLKIIQIIWWYWIQIRWAYFNFSPNKIKTHNWITQFPYN